MWRSEKKNPFQKSVFDEGWEKVEIKQGVKQVVMEKEKAKKEGEVKDVEPKHNKRISKQ